MCPSVDELTSTRVKPSQRGTRVKDEPSMCDTRETSSLSVLCKGGDVRRAKRGSKRALYRRVCLGTIMSGEYDESVLGEGRCKG